MDTAPQRSGPALALGVVAAAVTALPALALAPWMLVGISAGLDGGDLSSGAPGPIDWATVATCSVVLVLCVAVPLLVGRVVSEVTDAALRRYRRSAQRRVPGSA